MTTAPNIVVAPGPAFALPSGGGGPTVMTKPWPEWAMLRAEEVREKLPPEQWGPWTNRGPCLVSNNTTDSSQMQPHPTEEPHFFHCKAHLQAITSKETPPSGRVQTRDKGRCTSCGGPAAAAAHHDGRPSRVRPSGEDQQHGGSPERQTTLRQMQPEPSPAVPRPDVPKGHGQKHWVQSAGCCNITKTSRRRHCAECCAAAAANLSAQVMPPTTIAAGTAARRKSSE